jgi:hypothetical protein
VNFPGISIPADILKRARFIGAGLAVSMAVLVPGTVWYKGAMRSMSESSSHELAKMLTVRLTLLRQQMATELAVASGDFWDESSTNGKRHLRRDFPFDLVAVFDRDRRIVDGFRYITATKSNADLLADAARRVVPADSRFFDQVTETQSSSGILMIDGRPLLVAVRRIAVKDNDNKTGFALVGRWLDGRRLASDGGQAESGVEIFSLTAEDSMTSDVREAVSVAQRNHGFTYDIDNRGDGVVYALLDDISDRPAIVAKVPWALPWKTSGTMGFGMFYSIALLAGVCTWGILTWNDTKNKRRVRRFDGLSSLTVDHIRTLVEAFPGYAFAVKSDLQYVGVSRILAGVTGQESSYFAGQAFGTIASEWNDGTLVSVFTSLRDPTRWPRTAKITHAIEGLGERHEFSGMAHYLAKQDLLLVILTQIESAENKNLPGSAQEALSHQAVA